LKREVLSSVCAGRSGGILICSLQKKCTLFCTVLVKSQKFAAIVIIY
jgi:hypothetical protein